MDKAWRSPVRIAAENYEKNAVAYRCAAGWRYRRNHGGG